MSLAKFAKDKKIKQFLISFTDLSGIMRSKLVPASAIAEIEKSGAGFAGFAAYLDMTPADPDIFAMPDAASAVQLPWHEEVAWVPADLYTQGMPLTQAPRVLLKEQIKKSDKKNIELKTGVECEFFLTDLSEHKLSDENDNLEKPCYEVNALYSRFDIINEISEHMQTLGWGPYQADHEDANGQFEMNWDYADALTTADRVVFFQFMVKSVAQKHGFRASFMPKPFSNLTGNGAHMHFSLWDKKTRKNLFEDKKGELGLSKIAYHFLGGLMHNACAFAAISNPTINSYKRLHARSTTSGATWSPNTVSYSGNNRTHMVRIPDSDRLETRLPDGAANPYLVAAALLALGMEGINKKSDPGKRQDTNSYEIKDSLKKLPANLHDALLHFSKNKIFKEYFGDDFVKSYIKIKTLEWENYMSEVSQWEVNRYF